MNPRSTEDISDAVSGADNTVAQDRADAVDSAHTADLAREELSIRSGASADSPLIALLEELRASSGGEGPAAWSVLTDAARLRAVDNTGLLGPGPHTEVEKVLSLTVEAVGIPFAALNIISDVEQTTAGIATRAEGVGETDSRPLPDSLCVYPVMSGNPLIIDDMSHHPMLNDHPTARSGEVGAYLGIPIVNSDGQAVGTLCAWDTHPHHWTSGEVQIMTDLADVVCNVIFDR